MLNLPNSNILLCVEPTDMRKSFDSLAMLVQSHLGGDPPVGKLVCISNFSIARQSFVLWREYFSDTYFVRVFICNT